MKSLKKKLLLFSFVAILLSSFFPSVPLFAEDSNAWVEKSSMADERRLFQTEVINGKIYAIGGTGSSGTLNSVEEYNPISDTWTSKAPMSESREVFQTIVLDGKIYAIGGNGSDALNSVEEYDLATDTWTTKASMHTARYSFQAVTIDGKIYAIGGRYSGYSNSLNNSVEEYDPATDTWTTKAPMNTARIQFRAVVIDRKIYVMGGYNGKVISSVEEYDPATDTWTTKSPMKESHNSVRAETLDGKIYVIDGHSETLNNSVEEYDPSTDTWTTKAPVQTVRIYHSLEVVDGKIYAIGGSGSSGILNSVEEYDPATDTWTTKPSLNNARLYHNSETVNGKIYAIGGYTNSSTLPSVEEYTVGNEDSEFATNLTATGGKAKVSLSWDAVTDATGYTVQRSETAGGPYTTIAENVTETSYTDTSVTNGTTYYYIVTAVGEDGDIGDSNEASATPHDSLFDLTATGGDAKVTLSWHEMAGATGYIVKRSETSGGPYTTIADNVTDTSYIDTSVTNGTTYYYIVTAINADGTIGDSNEASATPQADSSSGRAMLVIQMTNGDRKEYDLAMSEVNAFISWYGNTSGSSSAGNFYIFDKNSMKGPFTNRKEYLVFDQISDWEVMQYNQ